jgi:hypothetical protein
VSDPNDFMFDPHFRYTSAIMASWGLDPALAFFPCSRELHVKGGLLPEDSDISVDIGISFICHVREMNFCLRIEDFGTCHSSLTPPNRLTDSTIWLLDLCHPLFAFPGNFDSSWLFWLP